MKNPINIEKKIEKKEIETVTYKPLIKKNILDAPESSLGSKIYHPQL